MNNQIKLISDDACDLTEDDAQKYNIAIIPFYVNNANNSEKNLNTEELYSAMVADNKAVFKTACPSINTYFEEFEKAIKNNQSVICVCITSKFSGSYNSACNAKDMALEKYPEAKIEIIDSMQNAVCDGLLVLSIAQMIEKGLALNEIVSKAEEVRNQAITYFSVATLDYLRTGGRIGMLKSVIAKTLDLKPIIIMKDGDITSGGVGMGIRRTTQKVLDMAKNFFVKTGEKIKDYFFAVGYGYDKSSGEKLLELVKTTFSLNDNDILFRHIGATTAVHTGPYPCGVGFMKKWDLQN